MKKHLFLLTFLTLTLVFGALKAQYYVGTALTPEDRARDEAIRKEYREKFQKHGVKSITIETQLFKHGIAKGEMRPYMQQKYNQLGQNLVMDIYQKNGKAVEKILSEYDQNGRLAMRAYQKGNGKLQSRTDFAYSGDLLTGLDHYRGSKETLWHRQENEYDALGWLQASNFFNPKNEKLLSQMKCSYHEDGSKKRVERYNRRGKLKTATDYACGQEGKTLSGSKVKEIAVCERFEMDANGKTIKIVETLAGENGDIREITKYNEQGNQVERVSYDKNGQIDFQFFNTYDDNGYVLTSARHGKGGKLTYRATYERGQNGLAISETQENEKGEIVKKQRYTYEYF